MANARSGTSPAVRSLNMLTRGEPREVVKAWLDFILGDEGQHIAVKAGCTAASPAQCAYE